MEKKLNLSEVLSNAFAIGLKNFLSLLGCYVLWILTIWIPYVNVGTTIAIATLPAALSKGKVISPMRIFDKNNYKYMGEFFLVNGLQIIILIPAMMFLFIPAIVLSIAYSLSTLLVIDKGKGASEALKISNKATYGNKWTIFFTSLLLFIPIIILGWIWHPLSFIYLIFLGPVMMGAQAYIYNELTSDILEE